MGAAPQLIEGGRHRILKFGPHSPNVAEEEFSVEQFHQGQGEFAKGNPEPCKRSVSHREDVTLNNPLSPPARGWDEVAETMDRGASPFKDGKFLGAETIAKCLTPELAYVVEIERGEAKVGGSEEATLWALRATMIFRPEETASGRWCIATPTP